METDLEHGYTKMYKKRNKTHVADKDKMGKQLELLQTTTFSSKINFGQRNSLWKYLKEENPSTNPEN
jgi:hypothetical protein